MNYQIVSIVCLIVAAFAALLFANLLLFFSKQITLYQGFFQSLPGTFRGMIVDNPGFIAVWGFFFFILLILYEFFKKKIIIRRTNLPPQV